MALTTDETQSSPDPEDTFALCELDEDLDELPVEPEGLGALGQLLAAGASVVVLGLLLVGVAGVLGWIFR